MLQRLSYWRDQRPSSRHFPEFLAILLLIVTVVLTYLPRREGPIDIRWDAGTYYVLGTSLAQGNGYRLLNEPGNILADQYPPLVPVIIAIHEKVLGTADYVIVGRWLKVTWLLLLIIFVVCSYFWLKRFLPETWALAAAISCGLNFQHYFQSSQCSADLPFSAVSIVFLLLVAERDPGRVRAAATGTAAIAAFLVRSVGIAILASWIVDAVLRKQWRGAAARCAVALSCLFAWQMYIRAVEASPEYARPAYPYQREGYMFYNVSYAKNMAYRDPFRPELGLANASELVYRILENTASLPVDLAASITSPTGFWRTQSFWINRRIGQEIDFDFPIQFVLFTLGTIILAGLVLLALDRQWVVTTYVVVSILAIVATPWPGQMLRYLAPLTPCLLLAVATVGRRLLRKGAGATSWLRGAAIAVFCALLLEQTATWMQAHWSFSKPGQLIHATEGRVTFRHLIYGDTEIGLDECLEWIAGRAQRSDVVAVSLPQRVFINTGLKAVMPPLEIEAAKASLLLDSVPVKYILLDKGSVPVNFAYDYLEGVTKLHADRWRLAYAAKQGDVRVFERISQ